MYCKKCGKELAENSIVCPDCGTKVHDGFPVWVIVALVVIVGLPVLLFFIGIVAALTLPTLLNNTESVRYKTVLKKEFSVLNQALLMSEAINNKLYSDFDDVWTLAIKDNLMNPVDIENGIIMADGTEVKYDKTGKPCIKIPENPTKEDACAILTIDGNGFDKLPNKTTEKDPSGRYNHVNDQFKVLLYSSGVVPESGSAEEDILAIGVNK